MVFVKLILILTISKTLVSDVSDLFSTDNRLELYRSPITIRTCTELKDDTLGFDIIGKEGKISLKALTSEKRAVWLSKVRQHELS